MTWVSSRSPLTLRGFPGPAGGEQLLLVDGAHRHVLERALERACTECRHEPCHGSAMSGDFDLLACGRLVEQAEHFFLGYGCSHLFRHMTIILVISSEGRLLAVTSL